MDFYASLTINRCHFDRLCEIWGTQFSSDEFPFNHAIVSPLFARNGILERLYKYRHHCRVIFDSGGFHIQQGRMELPAASRKLRRMYTEHRWADRFAVPDAPITSLDSAEVVRRKLDSTRRQYRSFPIGFSDAVRRKLLPVVHGTTPEEIFRSAAAARRVGSESLGFGGFSTSGPNGGVNSFSPNNLRLLVQFATFCAEWKLRAHAFGIGGPSAIAVLRYVPVDTFDSAGWIRTAAYGNVYLPYIGAVNITGAAASRRYCTKRDFSQLKKASGHICPFCLDHGLLVRSWPHRALHNYYTITLVTKELKRTDVGDAMENLRRFNPRFAGYLGIVLEERNRLLQH